MAKKELIIGAHVSTAGGYYKAFERSLQIGANAMQIFTKSNRMWRAKKITDEDREKFRQAQKESGINDVMVHASYLINLASKNPDVEKKSIDALSEELRRCEALGIKYLVLHPGSHLGQGEDVGLEKISHNIDVAFEKTEGTAQLLLETMAGQGTNLGYTFEQIHAIRSACANKRKIGVCLDTCHIFAAGYDLTDKMSYKKVFEAFDTIIGLNHLKAIHLNDSKMACGERRDRHAPLGEGKIPKEVFELLVNDPQLKHIPKILETPTDEAMELWVKEIAWLKSITN